MPHAVDASPGLLAQRRRIDAAFGGAIAQRVTLSKKGVSHVQGSARAETNMTFIKRALNDAAETIRTGLLPSVTALQKQLSAPDQPGGVVPAELAMLFGDEHKLAGLEHVRRAAQLVLDRSNSRLYLSTYAEKNKLTQGNYLYVHNHDGKEMSVLGSTNLGSGVTGPIKFTAEMAADSANAAFTTILHEHAHAIGYKIDDLGYRHEAALARLERSAPALAVHNADSVAHAALALSGRAGGSEMVRASHAERHAKIAKESATDSTKAHVAYVLRSAMPYSLRTAWPKKDVPGEMAAMDANYGVKAADWVALGGKLGMTFTTNDLAKASDAKDIMYKLTVRTQEIHGEVRGKGFTASDVEAKHVGAYEWMSGILSRGIASDPRPAPAKPAAAVASSAGGGTGKLTERFDPAPTGSPRILADAQSVAAVRDIVEDADLDDVVADVLDAFRQNAPYNDPQDLFEVLSAALPKGRWVVARRVVDYLSEATA